MRKAVTSLVIVGLIAGAFAVPAEAKKRKRVERKVTLEYQAPSPGISGVVGACMTVLGVEGTACVDTPLGPKDLFASVVVVDATGQATNFDLAQDTDTANPGLEIFYSGCGETAEPIAITPGVALRVSVTAAGGPDCPGVATTGSVELTLSNLP